METESTHWWHITKRAIVGTLIKKFALGEKLKILDTGCGTGKNVEFMKKFGKVLGIDNSKIALGFCRKRGLKNIKFAEVYQTHFPLKSFDIVTMLDVLEHTDNQRALKEIQRILNDNGILILTVPAFPWLWSRWDEILGHKTRYTKKSLKRSLSRGGFSIVFSSYMYSYITLPIFLIRKFKSNFSNENYTSDFNLTSKLINLTLLYLGKLERVFILMEVVPFGTTLVAVARKK